MKRLLLSIINLIGKKTCSAGFKLFSNLTRKVAGIAHGIQQKFDWSVLPHPEWMDHFCDQFYYWGKSGNPLWLERGVFNLLAMSPGANVLELCCGDGFNAYHCYSIRARHIVSVDFDPDAIAHAKRNNQVGNVEFQLRDIRDNLPVGKFDNIIWDTAIEHFTEAEIDRIIFNLRSRLVEGGIVSGSTMVEAPSGQKSLSHHEREFHSKEDLLSFFKPHFRNVKVFETIYPSRHNLYFFSSDGMLPFDSGWKRMAQQAATAANDNFTVRHEGMAQKLPDQRERIDQRPEIESLKKRILELESVTNASIKKP